MTTRREFLQAAGALLIAFSLPETLWAANAELRPPATLDGWLAIGPDGHVTVYCGKVELGTGIRTALAQMVAEEFDLPVSRIDMIMGDTDRVPDQGSTTGSKSIHVAGPQLRRAAARARQVLLARASRQLGIPVASLTAANGVVTAPDGRTRAYTELLQGHPLDESVDANVSLKTPAQFKVIGQAVPRVDLPSKVFGTYPYLHNMRLPRMRHGRVIRSAQPGARLEHVDVASVRHLPGHVKVVTRGDFVGVIADREEQAIQAARQLKVTWRPGPPLPAMEAMPALLRATPGKIKTALKQGDVKSALGQAATRHEASYAVPFQTHGSIGPSAAVADVKPDHATIWAATQSPFPLRGGLATLLGLPVSKVRVVYVEGSGCYGLNGADDAAADAALMSQLAGEPVRVQWMRQDEHGNDPKSVPMATTLRAGLDAHGNIIAWHNRTWSHNHSERVWKGFVGQMLAGQALGLPYKTRPGGADRNVRHSYVIPNQDIAVTWLESSPLRVAPMRGLGAPHNTFANESFIDELAAISKADPVAYRLRHLKDPRAIAALQEVARLSGWRPRPAHTGIAGDGTGRGVAFLQYENNAAYIATVVDVKVDPRTGKVRAQRVYVAHDCGLVVNPDGTRNQIEGCVIQGLSRALLEAVQFDRNQVTSLDWSSYPIMRFEDVPETIEISLINRPDAPPVGAGEATVASIYAAVANAIFDATGVRLREAPLNAERVQKALAIKA